MSDKKSSAPPAPDMSGVAAASKEAADNAYQLGEQQLQWAKDQYASNKATTDKVVDAAIATQNTDNANAAADRARYENTAIPLQDSLINDANTYATQQKKDQAVGAAQATVGQNFDAAKHNAQQSLESYGVNPASTRFGALDIGTNAMEAAAKAGAGNTAIQQTDQTARDLRAQAINVTAGLPVQSLNESNAGTAAGTGAVNNNVATTASGATTMGTGTQYDALGNQAIGTTASTMNSDYTNQLNQFKADQTASSGVGSAIGGLAGIGLSLAGMPGSSVGGSALTKLFSATGGAVPAIDGDQTPGGAVPAGASPTGGKAVDDVPSNLTVGEFVVPKDVAAWKGEEYFQKLIQQSRKAKQGAGAKPTVGPATAQAPTFQSRPQGAIPMGQAA